MAAPLPDAPPVDLAAAMVVAPATLADWLVILPVAIPLLTGALLVMMRQRTAGHPAVAVVGLMMTLIADLALLGRVAGEGPVTMMMGSWLPPFGIAFTADLLGTTLAAVGALIAICVALYAVPSINTSERRYGFYAFLMLLMAGVTGAFLTGDLFNLYVWFEVLLISSFGLMVVGSEPRQIDGTLKYGVLNLMATTLFLLATGFTYGLTGTLNMADIAAKAAVIGPTGPLMAIATLFLTAFAMKAAAVPVNMWLPASYHVPGAGVSALLAALLTKVGVYALFKVLVLVLALQGAALAPVATGIALATLVIAPLGALAQGEIRRLLNWLVISGIGCMLVGLALPTAEGLTGAIFYMIHSMIVMAALYMLAGMIEDSAGSGEIRRLGGLAVAEPLLAALALVLLLAVAGLPPLSGFWPKLMLVDAAFAAGRPALATAVLVNGFLTTLAIGRLFLHVVWRGGPDGTPDGTVAIDHLVRLPVADRSQRLVPVIALTALVVLVGLMPAPLHALVSDAAAGLLDGAGFARSVFGGEP